MSTRQRGWPRHFSAIGAATSPALSENVSGLRSNERTPCLLWLRHPEGSCDQATTSRNAFSAKPSGPPSKVKICPGHPGVGN